MGTQGWIGELGLMRSLAAYLCQVGASVVSSGDCFENLLLASLQQASLMLQEQPIQHRQHAQFECRQNQIDGNRASQLDVVRSKAIPSGMKRGASADVKPRAATKRNSEPVIVEAEARRDPARTAVGKRIDV